MNVEALGNDPYLRATTFGAELVDVRVDGEARLVISRREGFCQLHGIGPAPQLAPLVAQVLADPVPGLGPGSRVWLTPKAAELAGLAVAAADAPARGGLALYQEWGDWYWMGYTGPTPALTSRTDAYVVQLDPVADAGAIDACLARANPDASLLAGDPHLKHWWGYRYEGELFGVIADAQHGAGRLYELHSLGTIPEARGSGVGGALLRRSVAESLASNEALGLRIAILGVYADNAMARDWYERFGFGRPYARASFQVV